MNKIQMTSRTNPSEAKANFRRKMLGKFAASTIFLVAGDKRTAVTTLIT